MGAGSGNSRWELAMEPTTLRPHSGLARGARNGGACDGSWIVPDLPQIWYEKHVLIRRSHLVMNRTGYAHEKSSERNLVNKKGSRNPRSGGSGGWQWGLAVGTQSGGSRWEITIELTILRPHSGLAMGARNGGMRRDMIVPDLPQIWYETMSGSVADTWS